MPVGDPETRAVLDSLWDTLLAGNGVGLAAPQIGVAGRAFVIRDPDKPDDQSRIDCVNPVLEKVFGPEEDFEEGCLSFPGLYFDVRRRRGAVIRYHDAEGVQQVLKDDGLPARIAQHELDHLDGVLFIDRISRGRRFWLWPRLLWVAFTGFAVDLLAGRRSDG